MRTAEKTPEERTREMNGVLNVLRSSLPISGSTQYLKYADSSPYAYTTFANAYDGIDIRSDAVFTGKEKRWYKTGRAEN